jgi:hypothetical protein
MIRSCGVTVFIRLVADEGNRPVVVDRTPGRNLNAGRRVPITVAG